MKLKKKIRFYLSFYKSTINISLATIFIVAVLAAISGLPINKLIDFILFSYPTIGLCSALCYKEIMLKDEYPFYFNATCTKSELFIFSFLFSATISIVLYQINKYIWILFLR